MSNEYLEMIIKYLFNAYFFLMVWFNDLQKVFIMGTNYSINSL